MKSQALHNLDSDDDEEEEEESGEAKKPWMLRSQRQTSSDGNSSSKKKLWISLTREEIEEDLYAFTAAKPSRRPKKWPNNLKKQLDRKIRC
ncbi:uncharacterized protein LOC125210743 isoform X2 [Salvia hispanica]|uniref:uncharacterized protein LOC125210743 isoform X2 n=1 Tax=Salvia hispanica TaxID=49212 RepID=UPI002009250D|nr:uncharacterized protein LOC125210743 isoform X2 [Salvia hispanica]